MATDNFNRANGALGANWTTITSEQALVVASNALAIGSGLETQDAGNFWNAVSFANDQYSQLVLPVIAAAGSGVGIGVVVRAASAARTYYRVVACASGTELGKVVAGTFTSLKTDSTVWANGDTIRLEVTGQNPNITLTVKRNGSVISALTHTGETSINSGSAGVAYSSVTAGTATGDDWDGGDISAGITLTPAQAAATLAGQGTSMGFKIWMPDEP